MNTKIPESIKETASNAYLNFYERLTGNKIKVKRTFDLNDIDSNVWDSPDQKIREWATHFFPSCVLVSGSVKDNDHCQKIIDKLSDDIVSVYFSCSAHKNTEKLISLSKDLKNIKKLSLLL